MASSDQTDCRSPGLSVKLVLSSADKISDHIDGFVTRPASETRENPPLSSMLAEKLGCFANSPTCVRLGDHGFFRGLDSLLRGDRQPVIEAGAPLITHAILACGRSRRFFAALPFRCRSETQPTPRNQAYTYDCSPRRLFQRRPASVIVPSGTSEILVL